MAWGEKGRDLPPEWPIIRKAVLKRDGHQCTALMRDGSRCFATSDLEVDHIGDNADHSSGNLQTLCHWHHARRTAQQSHAAARKRRQEISRRFRRSEEHPGLR